MNIQVLEEKYIELLLKRCINFDNTKSLFINYKLENQKFIDKLVNKAKEMGVEDIYLDGEDPYEKHEILKNITLEEIEHNEYFNKKIWDEYANKKAAFLILVSEYPQLMDDISSEKLARANYIDRITKPIYKKLQLEFKIPWCIAGLPSKVWAKKLFPDITEDQAYEKLMTLIGEMCMLNTENPIESWNQFLNQQVQMETKLNDLEITKLHYQNSLGTDFTIELTENTSWNSAGSLGTNMLVNLPTYEIFTNPNFWSANGIVYATKPLCYNGGRIEKFYLEFKDGKVINYDAEKGKELLKQIIETDEYSCYLGEVALVNDNSPISNTKVVYESTLFDENASCHLALGNGFPECVAHSEEMSESERIKFGINPSKNHVDFMIGSPDLQIDAITKKGKVKIFKNGNFNL